ncbi:hypothetical protein EAH_00052940 [Eimeria acervulina]|uniref:Uncharacterized protein n=1 Tax=Eimeria acervulina TaxID=5801 RepID=U6GWA1_EIMAC|nr:hypothetical protein EAH_00052940 [Eimeria acervulina]CDI84480.1 hypothetical protein EAH_00052940 [Eimeria acervulina]
MGAFVNRAGCEVVLGFVGERATIIRSVRELNVSSDAFEQAMRACACAVVEAAYCSLVHATLRSVQRTLPHRRKEPKWYYASWLGGCDCPIFVGVDGFAYTKNGR